MRQGIREAGTQRGLEAWDAGRLGTGSQIEFEPEKQRHYRRRDRLGGREASGQTGMQAGEQACERIG